jgi:hypothetical protein
MNASSKILKVEEIGIDLIEFGRSRGARSWGRVRDPVSPLWAAHAMA